MPIYHTLGKIPQEEAHCLQEAGRSIYAEELVGHEGFTGTSAFSHIHPPTTVKSVRRLREMKYEADPNQTLAGLASLAREKG